MIEITICAPKSNSRASVIAVFERETIRPRTEAPSVVNLAHDCLDANQGITRIAYVILLSNRIPVFLVEIGNQWFDVRRNPITITGELEPEKGIGA